VRLGVAHLNLEEALGDAVHLLDLSCARVSARHGRIHPARIQSARAR
jgi:hypothetical protein